MHAAMKYKGPVYLRLVRDALPVIFPDDVEFEIGKGRVLREGGDIAIIGTGVQSVRALEAAELLAQEGIEAHVLHLPTVKPLDEAAIIAAAEKTGLVLTTEDGSAGEKGRVIAPLERALAGRDAAQPVTIYACGACAKARGVVDADLANWGAQFGNPKIFVSLIEWADRVITE